MRWSAPSERHYEIFCALHFNGRTEREVAADFGLSLPKLQLIHGLVGKWYAANAPVWTGDSEPVLGPLVSADIYNHRILFFHRQAIAAWDASQGEQSVSCKSAGVLPHADGWTKTRFSAGDPKYIALGVKLSKLAFDGAIRLAQWRLDHKEEEQAALAKYSDLSPYMVLAESEAELRQAAAQTPCAREAAPEPKDVRDEVDSDMLTDDEDETYARDAAPLEFGNPLISPPVRSRKERRKRQRLLEQAMAKRKAK